MVCIRVSARARARGVVNAYVANAQSLVIKCLWYTPINVPSYIKNANSAFSHHWPDDDDDNNDIS